MQRSLLPHHLFNTTELPLKIHPRSPSWLTRDHWSDIDSNVTNVTRSLCDTLHLLIETGMKPLTETQWQLEDSFVSGEDQTISSGIQNCRADLTVFQMFLDVISY
jgi:hypothetical protein